MSAGRGPSAHRTARTGLVAEGHEVRPQPLDDLASFVRPHHAWTSITLAAERTEIAPDHRVEVSGSPGGRSPSHASIEAWAIGPLRPHRPRGGTWMSGTPVRTDCSARSVAVRPTRQEVIAERRTCGLLVDERATHRDDFGLVDASDGGRSTLLDTIHDRLHERTQVPRSRA